MDNAQNKDSHKTFRNLFTRVAQDKRNEIRRDVSDREIKEAEDKAWDEWEEFNERIKRISQKKY